MEEKRVKISKKNIMEFSGLREAKSDEVSRYLKTIRTDSKSIIYAIICLVFFAIGVIGFCATPTIVKVCSKPVSVVVIIVSTIALLLAILFLIADILDREKALYAQRGKAYIADCFVYDKERVVKKDSQGKENVYYNVKVEDNEGKYINTWYAVDKDSFDTTEHPLHLFVFDYESKYVYDVRSDKMLGIKE